MQLIVTTTHGRPNALAALEKYTVGKQSTDDFDWLIVSDEWEGYKFPKKAKVIKRDPTDDVLPSICHNWLAIIEYLEKNEKYDKVIVMEDDDWYCGEYVRETGKLLDLAELVGWNEDAYYYVLARKARRCHNIVHASLAATAFKRAAIPWLKECVLKGDVFIDLYLWKGWKETTTVQTPDGKTVERDLIKKYKGKSQLIHNFTAIPYGSKFFQRMDREGNIANEHPRHVGMKTPWHGGTTGLSEFGHDPHMGGGLDQECVLLTKWVGEEASRFYRAFTKDLVEFDKYGMAKGVYPPNIFVTLPMENDEALRRL